MPRTASFFTSPRSLLQKEPPRNPVSDRTPSENPTYLDTTKWPYSGKRHRLLDWLIVIRGLIRLDPWFYQSSLLPEPERSVPSKRIGYLAKGKSAISRFIRSDPPSSFLSKLTAKCNICGAPGKDNIQPEWTIDTPPRHHAKCKQCNSKHCANKKRR